MIGGIIGGNLKKFPSWKQINGWKLCYPHLVRVCGEKSPHQVI